MRNAHHRFLNGISTGSNGHSNTRMQYSRIIGIAFMPILEFSSLTILATKLMTSASVKSTCSRLTTQANGSSPACSSGKLGKFNKDWSDFELQKFWNAHKVLQILLHIDIHPKYYYHWYLLRTLTSHVPQDVLCVTERIVNLSQLQMKLDIAKQLSRFALDQ